MKHAQIVRCLGFGAALVIAFSQAEVRGACDTPLPKDTKIDAPTDVSADQAKFLGIWNGTWNSGTCAVLAVKRIDGGKVELIYAYERFVIQTQGPRPYITVPADAQPLTGKLDSGALVFTTNRGTPMAFKMEGDKLVASSFFNGQTYSGTFTK